MAAEVLADHDVGRELAPGFGGLDVGLLEDGLAGLVRDRRGPELPLDLVVGMDVRARMAARPAEALHGRAVRVLADEAGAPGPAEVWGGGLGVRGSRRGCSGCTRARARAG